MIESDVDRDVSFQTTEQQIGTKGPTQGIIASVNDKD